MNDALSYEEIQGIVRSRVASGAAEAHGALAGMLCVEFGTGFEPWLTAVFGDAADEFGAAELESLRRMWVVTREHLESPELIFSPLLPEDDRPIELRAESLGEWCQGFLYGLGQSAGQHDWSDEAKELLEDLGDFTRIDAQAAEETDEEAYAELVEFIRMAVQYLRGEFENLPNHSRD